MAAALDKGALIMPRKKHKARVTVQPMETPTIEAIRNGDFERDFITHAETNTKVMAFRNTGGTPLCRWVAANKLDETQLRVINRCIEIWRLIGTRQNLVAKYGERLDKSSDWEGVSLQAADAEKDLASFKGHFPGKSQDYFGIFENVIRFNVPTGVAGGDPDKKSASTKVLTIVRFVCDVIASKERQFSY